MAATRVPIDVQRERWCSFRSGLRMVDPGDKDFALGGLGQLVDGISARILVLPSDPLANVLEFDEAFRGWFDARPADPFRPQTTSFGDISRPTSSALVEFERSSPGPPSPPKWVEYLAVHRSGAVDVALSKIAAADITLESGRTVRHFWMVNLIGRVWVALNLFAAIAQRVGTPGDPFEIAVALRGTEGAVAAGFAGGWTEPGRPGFWWDSVPQSVELAVLARVEGEEVPEGDGVREAALRIGDQLMGAFGSRVDKVRRRHGDFDAADYH